jgi:hypothetical protein
LAIIVRQITLHRGVRWQRRSEFADATRSTYLPSGMPRNSYEGTHDV